MKLIVIYLSVSVFYILYIQYMCAVYIVRYQATTMSSTNEMMEFLFTLSKHNASVSGVEYTIHSTLFVLYIRNFSHFSHVMLILMMIYFESERLSETEGYIYIIYRGSGKRQCSAAVTISITTNGVVAVVAVAVVVVL